jgi:hypothetical protein
MGSAHQDQANADLLVFSRSERVGTAAISRRLCRLKCERLGKLRNGLRPV